MLSQMSEGFVHSRSSFKDFTKSASQNIENDEQTDLYEDGSIISHGFGGIEYKYIHDYAYISFEEHLEKSNKIISITPENIDENVTQLNNNIFVKIVGNVVFVDMNAIKYTIENFSELEKAMMDLSIFDQINLIKKQEELELQNASNKSEENRIKQKSNNLIDKLRKNLPTSGLDEDIIKKLGIVLEFGFRDQFLIQMDIGNYIFSAECKPDNLREDRHLLIRKLSRIPEKKFVIVGAISQSSKHIINPVLSDQESSITEQLDVKTLILNFAERLSEFEDQFTGRRSDEIIIDPISVYWEI